MMSAARGETYLRFVQLSLHLTALVEIIYHDQQKPFKPKKILFLIFFSLVHVSALLNRKKNCSMEVISVSELFSNYWYFIIIFPVLYIVLQFHKRNFTSAERQKKEKHLDMETRNDSNAKAYTFQWKVEKLSYCFLKRGKSIKSPTFTTDALDGTKWSLQLFPKHGNFVSVFLKREEDFSRLETIGVKYQLAFLNTDGSILKNRDIWQCGFKRGEFSIWPVRETREKVLETERKAFLPEDTLTIQCKLWKKEKKPIVSERLFARTIFEMHRSSFVCKIDNFSTFIPGEFATIKKMKDGLINFDLVLKETNDYKRNLHIGIRSFDDDCIHLFSFKASIIDSEGGKVNYENNEYFNGDLQDGYSFPLSFSKTMLMKKKSLYFPNDALSLYCEYILSTATALYECARCGTPSSVIQEIVKDKNEINVEIEKLQLTPALVNDLKSMYSNAILCDVEIRTLTQSFPAHKAILSARSTVFRKMFSSDMKEKKSGHFDITDLEDEIVHRMLTYIYTDSLGDLQMESTLKLYMAADKYDITNLKRRCSSFLKDNMCPVTVCSVLVLADKYQHDDLKSDIQGYIMEHSKEVFDAQEWKHFMTTNLQLAADVMYRKVSQEKI